MSKVKIKWPSGKFSFEELSAENPKLNKNVLRKRLAGNLTAGAVSVIEKRQGITGRPKDIYEIKN